MFNAYLKNVDHVSKKMFRTRFKKNAHCVFENSSTCIKKTRYAL